MDESCGGQFIRIGIVLVIESGCPENQRREDGTKAWSCGWHFDALMASRVPWVR